MTAKRSTRLQPPSTLRWIDGSGGPLLLLPRELARFWQGIDPPAAGRVIEVQKPWMPDGPATDYDRACDIEGMLGTLEVGPGNGIVLAGEAYPTTAWVEPGSAVVVRWVAADTEAEIVQQLTRAPVEFDAGPLARIEVRPGPLLLFDAACPGDEIENDGIELALHPGSYLASAVHLAPGAEISCIAIRLRRDDGVRETR